MGATSTEIKSALIAAWPPGTQDLIDWDDAPGAHVGALASTVVDKLLGPVEELANGVSPITATLGRVRDWERTLKLAATRTALFSGLDLRRAQVVSRLRERGAPTVRLIQSVVAPLLGYVDTSQLVVLQPDRTGQRTEHTYGVGSLGVPSSYTDVVSQTLLFYVDDDAATSAMGVQFDLEVTGDLSQLQLTVLAPDGASETKTGFGRGVVSSETIRAYFPNFRSERIWGLWTLTAKSVAGSGNVSDASIFVEGFGRDPCGYDGLSASMFEWAAVYEPDKSNGHTDIDAARAAIQRLEYACRVSGLVFVADSSVGLSAGDYGMVPNDNAVPNGFVPNT